MPGFVVFTPARLVSDCRSVSAVPEQALVGALHSYNHHGIKDPRMEEQLPHVSRFDLTAGEYKYQSR